MYITQYFRMEELVPPEMHSRWRHSPQKLFMLFDFTALNTLDALRRRYGPLVVNNWHQGGSFRYSGWRPWDCAEGASLSQHKFGRAFDCKFSRISAEEVRQDLMAMPLEAPFSGIRRIEAFTGMSWFHFDTGNHDRDEQGVLVVGNQTADSAVSGHRSSKQELNLTAALSSQTEAPPYDNMKWKEAHKDASRQ